MGQQLATIGNVFGVSIITYVYISVYGSVEVALTEEKSIKYRNNECSSKNVAINVAVQSQVRG